MSGDRTDTAAAPVGGKTDRRLINPFTKWSHDEVLQHAEAFILRSGLNDYRDHLRKGASLAQSRILLDNRESGYGGMTLSDKEREALRKEYSDNRWDRFNQPKKIVLPCGLLFTRCCGARMVRRAKSQSCPFLTRIGTKVPSTERSSSIQITLASKTTLL